jgi:multiple sugar transport system substrate-binding protein
MKRLFMCLICLFLSSGLAFAGGEKKEIGGEITFWAMPNAPDETHIPWVEQKAEEFKDQTGVEVKFEVVGWSDAWPRISSAIATGEGADVFQVGTTWNPQFAAT